MMHSHYPVGGYQGQTGANSGNNLGRRLGTRGFMASKAQTAASVLSSFSGGVTSGAGPSDATTRFNRAMDALDRSLEAGDASSEGECECLDDEDERELPPPEDWLCDSGEGACNCFAHGTSLYSNDPSGYRFKLSIGDLPPAANTSFGEVKYAISPKILSDTKPHPAASGVIWQDVGHGDILDGLRGRTVPYMRHSRHHLSVLATNLSLLPDTTYYVHIWACDLIGNCGMNVGYPFRTHFRPPPIPTIVPDAVAFAHIFEHSDPSSETQGVRTWPTAGLVAFEAARAQALARIPHWVHTHLVQPGWMAAAGEFDYGEHVTYSDPPERDFGGGGTANAAAAGAVLKH